MTTHAPVLQLRPQGFGAENSGAFDCVSYPGVQFAAYLYLDLANTGLESVTQLSVEVSFSDFGTGAILGGEVFNFDVVSAKDPGQVVGVRFEDFAEVGEVPKTE